MANETTTTTLTEVIPVEYIPEFIEGYNWNVPVAMEVARIVEKADQGSVPYRFPRHDQFSMPAGTKTEGTGSFTRVAHQTVENSLTPGIVGAEIVLTDEAQVAARTSGGILASTLEQTLLSLVDRMDTDILAGITSATNTTGTVSDVFTRDQWDDAVAAYRALSAKSMGNMHAALLAPSAYNDLKRDERSASATSAILASSFFGGAQGFTGEYDGFMLAYAANAPSESSGFASCMTPIGPSSGLGIVVVEYPNARLNRGVDGESIASTFGHIRAWYGAGLVNQTSLLEILTN